MDVRQAKIDDETTSQKRKLQSRFIFNVAQVMEHFYETIFGQDHVLQHVENMLRLVKADIGDPFRPLYVSMYLGPTGVGKTETVRTLAKAIHGSPDHFCRVDMNTLSQEHYSAALTGAPPGYVGSKEGKSLFQKDVIEGSYSKPGIVLFDEIEKASPQVIQTLLNVFDNGVLALSSGEEVIDFRNSMIFLTSNIGSKQIQQFANRSLRTFSHTVWYRAKPSNWNVQEDVLLQRIVQQNLEKEFTPEFINRMEDILIFQWLKQEVMDDIVHLMIEQLKRRLEKKSFHLHVDPSTIELLMNKSFNQKYGARQVKRIVRSHLELPIVIALESEEVDNAIQSLNIKVEDRDITVQMSGKGRKNV